LSLLHKHVLFCRYQVGGLKHILVGILWKVQKICPMISLKTDIIDLNNVNKNVKGNAIIDFFFLCAVLCNVNILILLF